MKPEPTPEVVVDRMTFLARQLGNGVNDPGRERRFVESLGPRLAHERAAVQQRRMTLGITLAAAVLLAPVIGFFALQEPNLSYRMNGAASARSYIVAEEPTEVVFSDGSKFELTRGARAEVADVTAHGATLRLVEGTIALDIVKAKSNVWAVQAGPYRVHVVGTAFDVRWSQSTQQLEVDLHRGSVLVTGPAIQGELRLEPGQRLTSGASGPLVSRTVDPSAARLAPSPTVFPPDRAPVLDRALSANRELTPDTVSPDTVSPADTALPKDTESPNDTAELAPAAGAAVGSAPAGLITTGGDPKKARRESPPASPSWASWVAQSRYDRVIAAAKQRGIEEVLTSGTQSELAAFADASRYALLPKLARRALLAERSRFPKAAASRGSAFFLGGIEADGSAAALDWFEKYLAEAPNGAYVPQALGRRMMIVHRQRGKSESTGLAREYLTRFPHGPYATAAQQILGQFSE